MRVILLHQYFKTPDQGGGIRSWYLARALLTAGHNVEVVTAWNRKEKQCLTVDGITVHYLPVYYHNELGFFRRLLAFVRFTLSAARKILSLPKPDVVYAISTPLSIGLVARYIKWRKNVPYIFETGDLWPDVPIDMGYIKGRMLTKALKRIELGIYLHACNIVAMSPAMLIYFEKLGLGQKTICITNFADMSFGRAEAGPGKEFTITYAGTLGKANRLDYLLDLATDAEKRDLGNLKVEIMGEGAEREKLMKMAEEKKLKNVLFIDHSSKDAAIELMRKSTMVYLSFAPFEKLWTGSPNKYFDALAIGKPVLCNFGGWIAEEIKREQCGVVYQPGRPDQFFDDVWPKLQNEAVIAQMSQLAYRLAGDKYSLEKQLPLWLTLFGD